MKSSATFVLVAALFVNGSSKGQAGEYPREEQALSNQTRAILDKSEKFILYSLDPYPPYEETAENPRFHSHPILGQTEITDTKQKQELLAALYAAADEYRREGFAAPFPSCFKPRHGIKAVAGTNWVELLICFECKQVEEYTSKGRGVTMVGDNPARLFNRTLQKAKVPLSKK
jgi:hypothetical protein